MERIEYSTVDKSQWARGAWDDEPDKIQWQDEKTGLPCLIVRGPSGALCGYVGVDESHPCYEKDYDSVDVDVHGGLTFANHCAHGPEERGICHKPSEGEPDNVWWLGFDCAHSGDLCPSRGLYCARDHYKSVRYVEREVERLAEQLHGIAHAA